MLDYNNIIKNNIYYNKKKIDKNIIYIIGRNFFGKYKNNTYKNEEKNIKKVGLRVKRGNRSKFLKMKN